MKKSILVACTVVSVFFLTSCNKTDVEPVSAALNNASNSIVDDNANARSGSSTTDSVKTAVAVTALPVAITTYITTNYAGATITSAHTESDGSYDVFITKADATNAKLEFTADGTYIGVSTGKGSGSGKGKSTSKGKGGGKGKGHTTTTNVAVTQANLLATITTYLNTNYAGYTFVNAYSEAVSGVIVNYDVNITVGTVTYHVVFDAVGAFVSAK